MALCASHPQINRPARIPRNAAPKEEWVLRWLLKKLKSGKDYRVEPASFLLLRQLVDLIPPKILAAILKDHKFLAILNDSVADLEEGVFAAVKEDAAGSLGRAGSETSHTLSDSPHESERHKKEKKGMKRKRAKDDNDDRDPDAMDIDDEPQSPSSSYLAFVRLFDCLYSLVMLVNERLGVDEVASSHLKHALRGGLESVAVVLGKSFRVAAIATVQLSQWRRVTDLQHLLYVLPAVLELWELRFSRRDDSENKTSNVCSRQKIGGMRHANLSLQDWFAKHCFSHALRLQLCVRSIKLDTDERAQVLHGVERLIALHVVLPARAAFFDRGGSGIDYSADEPDWSPVQPVTEALRPLFCGTELQNNHGDINKKTTWRTAELLPGFFDTAARSVPRDTFRRQTHEAPWLETLFVAVTELAFSITKEESARSTYTSDFVRVLEQLLRVALDRKVQLSLHTLLTHASYTGLLKNELAQVEWSLTALFIKLGVDIFLPNSGLNDSGRLLNALLEKIMLCWGHGISYQDDKYEIIKNGIVIPLLRGFAAARDLATFIQVWHAQLVMAEEARSQNSNLGLFTVWEDDDLCSTYGELIQTVLTDAQVSEQIQTVAADLKDGKIPDSPATYARIAILEAGFGRRSLSFEGAHEAMTSIMEAVVSTLSSKKSSLHWRWRLWRLSRNLLERNMQSTDNPLGNAIMGLVDVASKSIKRLHKSSMEKKAGALLESFEAYRFAVYSVKDANTGSDQLDKFDSLTGEIAEFIKSISVSDASRLSESPWNGRTETLDSSMSLALGYFLTLLRSPAVWNQVKPEIRRSLFEQMLSLAAAQYGSLSSSGLDGALLDARFVQAWASLVCHEYLLNAPCVVSDLVLVLSERIKNDASNRRLHVESLQRIPALLITRRLRGVLLHVLLDVLLQKKDIIVEVTIGILSLVAKLAEMPKSTATITSDWEPIWKVAQAVSLQGTEIDLHIMKAFRNLHRAVMDKLLVVSEVERRKLFKKLYRKVSSKASKLRSIELDSMDSFFLRISLSQLWTYREELSGIVDEAELAACRQRMFDLVVAELKFVKDQCRKQKLQGTIPLIKTLDLLEDFEDLAMDNEEVEKLLSKMESYIEKSADLPGSFSLQRLIRHRVLVGRGPEQSITLPVMQCAETLSLDHLYGQEQRHFIRATTERFRSMPVESLSQVIKEIRESGSFVGDNNAMYRLLVVGVAVSSLPVIEDKESPTAKELSLLCTTVTESLPRSTSIEHFSLATECLDTLLRNQTRCITQWNIDNLLACIALCASPSPGGGEGRQHSITIPPQFAPTIYTRLCRVTGTLFSLHRQKLGGRFHLILPVMQRLLNCLFFSGKGNKTNSAKTRHRSINEKNKNKYPPWLSPLSPPNAVHFTRLLTSLCDPTMSAVSRPTHHQQSLFGMGMQEGLTDQTKKAKRIAGQYLQYLIMEYAQCCLRGSLAPEVKAAVLPGLYAVMDVMPKDTMRALNAGLDVSGRAVFKGLYDDYVRFGKWNKG